MYYLHYKKEIIEGSLKGLVVEVRTSYPKFRLANQAAVVLSNPMKTLGGGWLGPKAKVVQGSIRVESK